jgi:dephospho-CoA kinase
VQRFGRGILNRDGSVNRAHLAELVFGQSGEASNVRDLNRIVHPAVIRREDGWMEEVGRRDPRAIAMVEAALILEAGAADRFDRLIVVTCSEGQQVQRFAERLKIDTEAARREVDRRMVAQLPDEEKIKAADYVIDNSGSLDQTEKQVREVFAQLREESEGKSIGTG